MSIGPRKQLGFVALSIWAGSVVAVAALWSDLGLGILVAVGVGFLAIGIGQTLVDIRRLLHRSQTQDRKLDRLVRSRATTLRLRRKVERILEGGDLQLESVQSLRADMEWLEEILEGMSGSINRLEVSMSELLSAGSSARPRDHLARILIAQPARSAGTDSSRRINALLADRGGETAYLEIGVAAGHTIEAVQADRRVGVEPKPEFDVANLPPGFELFVGPSDSFFQLTSAAPVYDVVFVDGLHEFYQTYRDVIAAIGRLTPGGVLLVDDVVPSDSASAIPNLSRSLAERRRQGLDGRPWHGDVFRLIPLLKEHHQDLEYRTIVGSGNEQLVLWRSVPEERLVTMVSPDVLEQYRQLNYEDVFGNGVPEYFHCLVEEEAIEVVRDR